MATIEKLLSLCGNDLTLLGAVQELEQRRKYDIENLVTGVHQNAKEHGWWDDERTFGDIIALCHCELSEAMEEFRNGRKPNEIYYHVAKGGRETNDKPEGVPIELADVIIRIFDYCGREGIDIKSAILQKMEYNKSRPYKHGGKVL